MIKVLINTADKSFWDNFSQKTSETCRFHSHDHETYGYLCFLVHNLSETLLTWLDH
jgi:hypothetical protein